MKKILFSSILCILCFQFSYSQTVSIPDTAFEQALIDDGHDTTGILDGTILLVDAEANNSLRC